MFAICRISCKLKRIYCNRAIPKYGTTKKRNELLQNRFNYPKLSETLVSSSCYRNFNGVRLNIAASPDGAVSPWEQNGEGVDTRPEAYRLKAPEPPKKEEPKK